MLTPLCPSNLTLLHCSSFPFPYQFFVFPPNHLEHLLSFFRPLSHLTLRQAMSMYIHHTRAEMASKQTSASVKTWVEVDGWWLKHLGPKWSSTLPGPTSTISCNNVSPCDKPLDFLAAMSLSGAFIFLQLLHMLSRVITRVIRGPPISTRGTLLKLPKLPTFRCWLRVAIRFRWDIHLAANVHVFATKVLLLLPSKKWQNGETSQVCGLETCSFTNPWVLSKKEMR